MRFVKWFTDITAEDVPSVGGKNASLGEMYSELSEAGVRVPNGFSVTAEGYREFIDHNDLAGEIRTLLDEWDRQSVTDLAEKARAIRRLISAGAFPEELASDIVDAYRTLSAEVGVQAAPVAVRSSATAEDLPTASFAGQQETYLMVVGADHLLESVREAFASLFTARAVNYREDMGFDHFAVALAVGVQQMVRADLGASGVMFTLDPDSGSPEFVVIDGIWGLGENIVQGRSTPDEFVVHKPTLAAGYRPIVRRSLGAKELTMTYDAGTEAIVNDRTDDELQGRFVLSDDEVLELARTAVIIEDHYTARRGASTPMDIEWAKDGVSGLLYIVQARPETVHSQASRTTLRRYRLVGSGRRLAEGIAIGTLIASGPARVVDDPRMIERVNAGDILITSTTDPDWEPIMKRAAAIVTEHGGRTAHAAIISRELGIPAVVGVENARTKIEDGAIVTVCCAEGDVGYIYDGALDYEIVDVDPAELPHVKTSILLNVGDPSQAMGLAQLPVDGVGLARMEFVFAHHVRVHPLALLRFDELTAPEKLEIEEIVGDRDREAYFIETLSEGIGMLAAAFYPRRVVLRCSDFKSNEYRSLIGGQSFEPYEENPMIGWRGASRYVDPAYEPAFRLELRAIKRVREVFGLENLQIMIPFCRTVGEADDVLAVLKSEGLGRGQNGLKVLIMAEIPSQVLNVAPFAERFDGFSIGSNDLTQLVLGIDRDSEKVAHRFDERDPAVMRACELLLDGAREAQTPVGICGQAPSDFPEFAAFLVERGISSLSLNPDSLVSTLASVHAAESALN